MPRFVVLRHETPPGHERPTHWDFMLEAGGVLRTWALAEAPCRGRAIAAEELAEHRLAYLEYEGDVSGGRGSVVRWDAGTYEVLDGRVALQSESNVQHRTSDVQRPTPNVQPLEIEPLDVGRSTLDVGRSTFGEAAADRTLRLDIHGQRVSGTVLLTPVSSPLGHVGESLRDSHRASGETRPRGYWSFIWEGT